LCVAILRVTFQTPLVGLNSGEYGGRTLLGMFQVSTSCGAPRLSSALYKLQLGACLADDMGLGKTIQVIGYWLGLKERGEVGPHILVAPASLLANWRSELARFGPSLAVRVAHPSELSSDDLARFPDRHLPRVDVVLTTYGQLHRNPSTKDV